MTPPSDPDDPDAEAIALEFGWTPDETDEGSDPKEHQ